MTGDGQANEDLRVTANGRTGGGAETGQCRDVVVVGASAGGVEALGAFVAGLPADLGASVLVVLHVPATGSSALPGILSRRGPLPATHAVDGEQLLRNRIYVAPSDRHLLLDGAVVRVVRGPRENGHRPAVDPLFRTAARAFGARVVGVVLSGVLDDGAAGLAAVRSRAGYAIVQDPEDAMYPTMPLNAMERAGADEVLPAAEIGRAVARVVRQRARVEDEPPLTRELDLEARMAGIGPDVDRAGDRPGDTSPFSCPDCGGVLFELERETVPRFRCRVGHAWNAESLLAKQSELVENAMWVALRSLEERAVLAKRVATSARERGMTMTAARFAEQSAEAAHGAEVIRAVLERGAQEPSSGGTA